MATAVLSIKDKEDGVGVLYEINLSPVPKTQEEITMAQNMGLTMFDALEGMLKKFGAQIKPQEVNDGPKIQSPTTKA